MKILTAKTANSDNVVKIEKNTGSYPAGNYMFKFNNGNTRTRCEIFSKLTIFIIYCLLLFLDIFHTLFYCFYC